jgi:regulator of sirC expression with transglutaminase-like and TPR domain
MQETKELNALFTLIDDPDEEVYSTISERIVGYGKPIIPNLEHLWETSPDAETQQRIELIIHRLHFTDLLGSVTEWRDAAHHDLLSGSLLVSKFQYPDLQVTPVLQDIEKIRRNVWLELNNFLTPLEQANVLSSIIYKYYQLKGVEVSYTNADEFFIHKVLESKKGNTMANGIIYQILCEKLEINARIINIPKQCIIAFYESDYDHTALDLNPMEQIHFFVDATSGQAFSHKDIEGYFKKIAVPSNPSYFKPLSNKRIIQNLLQEITKCYDSPGKEFKRRELIKLTNLLD